MKTAVEWVINELKLNDTIEKENLIIVRQIIEQAKELEKQQIIDARVNGMCNGIDIGDKFTNKDLTSTHEQYYNETFNK
jgi:hypothetical protein